MSHETCQEVYQEICGHDEKTDALILF